LSPAFPSETWKRESSSFPWSIAIARTRYQIYDTDRPYFMTCSIVGWLPVFTRPACVDFLYESLRFAQKNEA
jgi:hypothetical protein